ncbi:MAG: glycosyltransferase family 39 protein [Crocinitomicaceae bacterium]
MTQIFKSNQFPFWMLALTVVTALILPVVLQEGMFMDGVLYACVSNNLAQGFGSMWFLKFSELGFANFATFHEHPPLIFWIQGLFFKLFGSSMYVERFYTFGTALIATWLLHKNWKLINYKDTALSKNAWLAVVFWMLIPIVFWSYRNNVQENTMTIFVLLSSFFALKAIHLKKKVILNLVLSGIMVFAASFAKGVPGFFPLVIVPAFWLVYRPFSFIKMIAYSFVVTAACVISYLLILLIPEARESLSIYVFERLLRRVDVQPTVDSHFYIMIRLFMEVLPLIVIVVVVHFILWLKKIPRKITKTHWRVIGFFFILGICGSLPVMLTLVQKTFYIGSSLPYFAICFAMMVAPLFSERSAKIDVSKKGFKFFKWTTVIGFIAVIVFSITQSGKVSRNEEVLADVHTLGEIVPHHSLMSVDPMLTDHWDLHVYLMRYYNISMDHRTEVHQPYLLVDKTLPFEIDSAYHIVDVPTVKYDLYHLENSEQSD